MPKDERLIKSEIENIPWRKLTETCICKYVLNEWKLKQGINNINESLEARISMACKEK